MMNSISRIITISAFFIVYLSTSCEKRPINEEDIFNYYEINKQKYLKQISPIVNEQNKLFKIVHISDAHVSSWSSNNNIYRPYNLIEAVLFANDSVTKTNLMVNTGDHINNNLNTTREKALNFLDVHTGILYKNNQIPTLTITGNHDANILNQNRPEYALSKTDIYNHLTSKINYPIHSNKVENYYYADISNPMGGVIRIIALDVIDQDNTKYDAQHYAILSQKQIDWFCHTALKESMTKNHSVIVLIHHPLPTDDESVKKIISNEFLYNWNLIPEVIEAFRTKQAISKKYRNNLIESDSISVNISFENSPGEFICYLGGHIHTYLNYEVRSSKNLNTPLPKQIMIVANNMSPSEKNSISPIKRATTGLHNNTFNIYAINTISKNIYISFFGAMSYYYPQILTLRYL